jgi:hypothetical protein
VCVRCVCLRERECVRVFDVRERTIRCTTISNNSTVQCGTAPHTQSRGEQRSLAISLSHSPPSTHPHHQSSDFPYLTAFHPPIPITSLAIFPILLPSIHPSPSPPAQQSWRKTQLNPYPNPLYCHYRTLSYPMTVQSVHCVLYIEGPPSRHTSHGRVHTGGLR